MRLVLILGAIVLLCGTAGAAHWFETMTYTDTVEITSFPYTANQNNTVYFIDQTYWTNSYGVTVACDTCKFDGGGFTVTYDSNFTDDKAGVHGDIFFNITNGCDYVHIDDWIIRQAHADTNGATFGGSYGGDSAHAIAWIDGCNSGTNQAITNCEIYTYGRDCNGILEHSANNLNGIYIRNVRGSMLANTWRDRQENVGFINISQGGLLWPTDTFNVHAVACTVYESRHCGILIGGYSWIDSCDVLVDAFNDLLITTPASSNSCDNDHMYGEKSGARPGWKLTNSRGRAGVNGRGGKGIYVGTDSYATSANPIIVDNVEIHSWQGYTGIFTGDEEAGSNTGRGLRTRYGIQWLQVTNSKLYVYADDDAGTTYMGNEGHGIWFTTSYEDNDYLAVGCKFDNNDIRAIWLGAQGDEQQTELACFRFDGLDSASYTAYADSNESRYNWFGTQALGIWNAAGAGAEFRSYRDSFYTVELDSAWLDSVTGGLLQRPVAVSGERIGFNWCSNNRRKTAIGVGLEFAVGIEDMLVVDPRFDGTLTWDSVGPQNGSATDKYLRYGRTVALLVTTEGAVPISGANISVVNISRSDTVYVGTTNANGRDTFEVDIRGIGWNTCTKTADTTFPIKFIAAKDGDTAVVTDTLDVTTSMGSDYPVTIVGLAAGDEASPGGLKINTAVGGLKIGAMEEWLRRNKYGVLIPMR